MDGKHSMRLQNVNVYVWTGPDTKTLLCLVIKNGSFDVQIMGTYGMTTKISHAYHEKNLVYGRLLFWEFYEMVVPVKVDRISF